MAILFIFSILFFSGLKVNAAEDNKKFKIIVFHSYNPEFPAYPKYNQQLLEKFKVQGIDSDIRFFYLDCEQYNPEEELVRCYEYIEQIKSWQPDLLLVNDDQGTYSLLACQHPFLKTIPIIFAGVNFPNWSLLKEYSNVTGIWDLPDYVKNIEMIEQLFGKTRILFFHDLTYLGKQAIQTIAKQLIDVDNKTYLVLKEYIENNYNDSILQPLSPKYEDAITPNTQTINHTHILFPNLQNKTAPEALWMLSGLYRQAAFVQTKFQYNLINVGKMTAIPTFSVIDEGIGYNMGIVGGYVTTPDLQAAAQARYVSEILLAGKAPSELPVVISEKKFVLDWVEVEHWNIPTGRIPADYEILNQPAYVKYKSVIIFIIVLITLLLVSIFSYLLYLYFRELKQKRIAQNKFIQEQEFLALSLEESSIYSWKYNEMEESFLFDNEFYKSLNIPEQSFSIAQMIQITHPDDRDMAENTFYMVKDNIKNKMSFQSKADFNGQGYVWYEFRYTNVAGKLDDSSSVIGLIINIQEYKEKENELTEARDLAAKAELKQSFLANMSHEIRTPLNAIVGFSSLLIDDEELDPEDKKEYIDTINKNCELLLKLINDILEISRIESGNMTFVTTPTDLNTIIEDIYKTHSLLVPDYLKFIKDIPDKPLFIEVDASRLKQVITNFINNAVKFTTQGYIMVGYSVDKEAKKVSIYVEDTGKGIPSNEQKMIFERFYKQDEFAQGTGLGLSISKVIIEKMDGNIELKSELGKGSRFTIIVPYSPEEQKNYFINARLKNFNL